MRSLLFAFTLLAGLAGGIAAGPANAAPSAHGLLPAVSVLPVVAPDAVPALNEGAVVQDVQYYRRRFYRPRFYGRRFYGRRFYRPRYYRY